MQEPGDGGVPSGTDRVSTETDTDPYLSRNRDFPLKKSATKPASNPAPKGLSPAAVAWWKRLHSEFDLRDAGAAFLLESALRAFDRMREAGALIDKHGVCITDRYQQLKPNPAVAAERDSRAAMLAAFKQLGLDVIPPQKPGRPAGR